MSARRRSRRRRTRGSARRGPGTRRASSDRARRACARPRETGCETTARRAADRAPATRGSAVPSDRSRLLRVSR
ncbi:MAG: hypothetical protein FJX57_24765 [Alphaproteobacteria bacterium]|nr:hypothetical protein [Alphaproteobacteria bacterium]